MQSSRTFRVFISSTFSDLKAERNALQEKVFPRLKKLAAANGCRFQAIDLRWGVSDEAALDQRTMEICLGEVDRCQKKSPRPNFIVLMGDRYGWKPLPYEILADEFEQIIKHVSEDEKTLLTTWYLKDINAVPAHYILQPRKVEYIEYHVWEKVENQIRSIFLSAIDKINITPEAMIKYTASATEQEIMAGAMQSENAKEHVFGYIRDIEDMPEDSSSKDFRETDIESHEKQKQLKAKIKHLLGENACEYKSNWENNAPSQDHIDKLCEDVYKNLSNIIQKEIDKLESVEPLTKEIDAHKEFGADRARVFIGREDIIKSVHKYIYGDNNYALLVWGESGCGKSALMAKVIEQNQKSGKEVIYRFIGATPESSDGRNLLESLYRQISKQYETDTSDIPSTYQELIFEFPKLLELATNEKPLIIFLDALDQLSDSDNARSLSWMPNILPPDVKIIVSTAPGDCLEVVENRLPKTNILQIQPMSLNNGEAILDIWLKEARRTLQPEQRKNIINNFKKCSLPLYLKLAFEEARRWHSYDGLPVGVDNIPGLGSTISKILDDLFWRLSKDNNHGKILVSHSLGYLSAAKNGLSEEELLDVLSMDKSVLDDFVRRSPNSPKTGRTPFIIWSRLYADLEPYLAERAADGSSLLSFYHRQLGEAVQNKYLSKENKSKRHIILAKYFTNQELDIEQNDIKTPNLRKLTEQPYQQTYAGKWSELKDTLSDFDFMEAKCKEFSVYELQEDYNRTLELWNGEEEDKEIVSAFEDRFRLESHNINAAPELLFTSMYNNLVWMDMNEKGPIYTICNSAGKKRKNWLRNIQNQQKNPRLWELSLSGHIGSVNSVSMTLDNKYIISGSDDNTIKIWDFSTQKLLHSLEGHTREVTIVTVASNQKYIISASVDKTIRVWEICTGKQMTCIEGHTGFVLSVCVTPNSKYIISGSSDNTIKVWEISTGKLLHCYEGHTDNINSIKMTKEGKFIVSGSKDNTIKIWEFSTGKLIKTLVGHTNSVNTVCITFDDRYIVTGSDYSKNKSEGDMIKIWELSTGKLIRNYEYTNSFNTIELTPNGKNIVVGSKNGIIELLDILSGEILCSFEGHDDSVNSIHITPNGRYVISGSRDMTIKVWEFSTSKLLFSLEGHTSSINAVYVTPNCRYIVSGSSDKTIKVWEFTTGRLLRSIIGHIDSINTLCITQDGKYVVSGSGFLNYRSMSSADNTIRIWEFATGILLRTLEGHTNRVNTVILTPNGRHIISGSSDKTIKIWEFSTGMLQMSIEESVCAINSLSVTPDNKYIVSGSGSINYRYEDSKITVWELATGKLLRNLEEYSSIVRSVKVTQDGKYVVSASNDNIVKIWDLPTGKLLRSLKGHTRYINAVDITSDGKYIVSGAFDNTVKVWEFLTGKLLHNFEGHTVSVKDVTTTPDGRYVVSVSGGDVAGQGDKSIKVWDILSDRKLHSIEGHKGIVNAVCITPNGEHVISGSSDNKIKVWELSTGKLQMDLEGCIISVNTISVTPDNRFIISGSGSPYQRGNDNRIRIWELSTGKLIRCLEGHMDFVVDVCVSADGKYIISGSWDNTIKLWDIETGKVLRSFEGHNRAVNSICVTSNEKYIISGSSDNTIKVWDMRKGAFLFSLKGHKDTVNIVRVTADSKYIISGAGSYNPNTNDNTIKIWELKTGILIHTYKWHKQKVIDICIMPDNEHVLSTSNDRTVKYWHINGEYCITVFRSDYTINALSISKDGKWLSIGEASGRVWIFEWMNSEYGKPQIMETPNAGIKTLNNIDDNFNESSEIIYNKIESYYPRISMEPHDQNKTINWVPYKNKLSKVKQMIKHKEKDYYVIESEKVLFYDGYKWIEIKGLKKKAVLKIRN